ncbi:MAG: hypothetical protein DMF51_00010 [Acidobacteria bacterium]|nr:MAG: hypothetical protein DMF51_00010 [Acidobacteriota bacterium]
MKALRTAVILLAVVQAGWITFDGARALMTGDYLKPRLGAYGGQLGEWTRVASALGAPPRSAAAKWALIGYGLRVVGHVRGSRRRALVLEPRRADLPGADAPAPGRTPRYVTGHVFKPAVQRSWAHDQVAWSTLSWNWNDLRETIFWWTV